MNLLILGILSLSLYLLLNSKYVKENIVDISGLNSNDVNLYNFLKDKINNIIKKYALNLEISDVLAVVKRETGFSILQKPNSELIGDKNLQNKAIGLMQVRKPALLDVNNFFDLNLTENDLLELDNSLLAGTLYLELCRIQANKENLSKNDAKRAMFFKYNSGIGKRFFLNNYVSNVYSNYLSFNKLIV